MDKQYVKEIALDNGFKLKEQPSGEMDLNPYVYQFADALCNLLILRSAGLEQERDHLKAQNSEIVFRAEAALGDLYFLLKHQKINSEDGSKLLDGQGAHELQCAIQQSPAACLAEIQAKAIEDFKEELIKSVSVMFRPHIEGVCAVLTDQLRQQSTISE